MIILSLLICLLAAACFAGLETGLLAANQLIIYSRKERGVLHARAAEFLLLKPERLLSTTLIGTNTAVVTAAVLLNSTLRGLGLSWGSWLGGLSLSILFLLFAEIIPKSFFRRNADEVAVRLAPLLVFFYFLFLPVSILLNLLIRVLLLSSWGRGRSTKLPRSRDDLRLLVRLGGRESGLDAAERRLFDDIFAFRDTLAREVMIPLQQHPVCRTDTPLRELAKLALEEGRRFIPLYSDRADNLSGYVDARELLTARARTAGELMKKPVFYPETKRIPELLREMNSRKIEIVFLVDEYGILSGLLTPAQIAAEIVGFIPGAQPPPLEEIKTLAAGGFLIAGDADTEDVARSLGVSFPKGHYDTIGGFLCERLGEIPKPGVTFEENGLLFTVVDGDERRIGTIEIRKKGSR